MHVIAQYSRKTKEKCATYRRPTGGGLADLPRRAILMCFYLAYLQNQCSIE